MEIDRPDYSIYTYYDTWTLADALSILKKHYKYIKLSNNDNIEEDDIDRKDSEYYWDSIYSCNGYSIDEPLRKYVKDGEGDWIRDIDGELTEYVDFNSTRVNIKEFIKYTVTNDMPFPKELIDYYIKGVPLSSTEGYVQHENLHNESNFQTSGEKPDACEFDKPKEKSPKHVNMANIKHESSTSCKKSITDYVVEAIKVPGCICNQSQMRLHVKFLAKSPAASGITLDHKKGTLSDTVLRNLINKIYKEHAPDRIVATGEVINAPPCEKHRIK